MVDVKSQIADMMTAYERYLAGKSTGQGVTDNRREADRVETNKKNKASKQPTS